VLFKAVGSMTINCFIVLLFRYIPIYIENQSCRYVFLACYTQFGDKLNAEYIQRGMSQLLEAPTLVYFSCSVCTQEKRSVVSLLLIAVDLLIKQINSALDSTEVSEFTYKPVKKCKC
jgi:hypothetical protein